MSIIPKQLLGANEPTTHCSVEAGLSTGSISLGQAAVFDQCSSGRPCRWLLVHQWCRNSMELIPFGQNAGTWFLNIHESMNTDYLGVFKVLFFSCTHPDEMIQCEHSFQLSDSQVETLQSHRRHDGFLHLMYKAGVFWCFWEIWAWNIKPGLKTPGTQMLLISFVYVLLTRHSGHRHSLCSSLPP